MFTVACDSMRTIRECSVNIALELLRSSVMNKIFAPVYRYLFEPRKRLNKKRFWVSTQSTHFLFRAEKKLLFSAFSRYWNVKLQKERREMCNDGVACDMRWKCLWCLLPRARAALQFQAHLFVIAAVASFVLIRFLLLITHLSEPCSVGSKHFK